MCCWTSRAIRPRWSGDFAGFLCDERLEIDGAVAASELAHAWQNRAIASLMRGKGTLTHEPEGVVAAYCRQCALTMSCRQLARAFLPLAAGGFSPVAQETVFPERPDPAGSIRCC